MSMKEAMEKAGFKGEEGQLHKGSSPEQDRDQGLLPIILDKNGMPNRDLLTIGAEKWADALYRGNVSRTKLRKFYNEVKALQDQIDADGFNTYEPMVAMLKPKVAYDLHRARREERKGLQILKDMIEQGVDISHSPETFGGFALFFESVVGFFKG